MSTPLILGRDQILSWRRVRAGLGDRRPWSADHIAAAAAPGLQDSMPRAAVLSLHARLHDVPAEAWQDPALVQTWGPRYNVYAVGADDVAAFTLGRLPTDARRRSRAEDLAEELADVLEDGEQPMSEAARTLGHSSNRLRYAAPTGRILIRWDGARQPTIRMAPAPTIDPVDARRELARRFLRFFGPASVESFAGWAGVNLTHARATFTDLDPSLAAVATPLGDAMVLAEDVDELSAASDAVSGTRLLPSGDAYTLWWGDDRSLLVEDASRRDLLWTSRVWPGALLADGEIVGTWRRSGRRVTLQPWTALPDRVRRSFETETASLPLPDPGETVVEWDG